MLGADSSASNQAVVAETPQCEVVDWAATNRGAHSPPDPNNERLQQECALGRTTDTQDLMHGKRPFPWPQQLPKLSFHEQAEQRVLRINWSEQVPVSASIHTQDRGMGIRLKSLLKVGSGIAALLRRRHRNGSLTIQLHDEDPRFPACDLMPQAKTDDPHRPLIPDPYCLMTGATYCGSAWS